MSSSKIHTKEVVILGAGNVATHLAKVIFKSGYRIKTIYSRTLESAKELALQVKADYSNDLKNVPDDADLYIISVKDDVIEEVAKKIKIRNGIVVHTAGGIPLDVLKNFKNIGVFYPLQTFTKSRPVDFCKVPIFIESSNENVKEQLFKLANSITKNVIEADSEKRKVIHLAAVFSCNFVNHMYTISSELLKKSDISFDLLKPLITETVNKAIDMQPENAQTGPALRNDKKVMENQLKMLSEYPEFEKIYRFVSNSIYASQLKK